MITPLALLAQQGCRVTVVTSAPSIVRNIPSESSAGVQARLRALGVRWICGAVDLKITSEVARFRQLGTDDLIAVGADRIVVETGRTPMDQLWRASSDLGLDLAAVGDYLTPRTIGNAVGDVLTLEKSMFSIQLPVGLS
jgi:NADPH-dependent 2,4-dienoyl-CoA reductase/sulfur reductase-like enzyme